MNFLIKHNKKVALLFLLAMLAQLTAPNVAYALTSGPSQPEMKGFEPIGNSDMVDLFSGDFSYNIPLMDVGGYPVNMAYHSGASMDDEASWVGYGWSLNAGSINRQMRGIPDDFNGSDKQEREMNMKDHITKGGRFSATLDLLGVPMSKISSSKKKKKKLNLSLTLSVGVKTDNYRGIGMELGANTGVSLTNYSAGANTGDKPDVFDLDKGATNSLGSLGLNLSSQDGASVDFNASILRHDLGKSDKTMSKSIGFGYNSRAGLTNMTLTNSVSSKQSEKEPRKFLRNFENSNSSSISFNDDTYTPTIDHPTKSNSYTFSLHLGPELWFAYLGLGVTGFYSKQVISQNVRQSPAYGYMNSDKGKDDPEALMDFNREKDIPYSKQVNYLPIPVPTYDLFSASSQDGGGQYRIYRGSSGTFFDNKTETKSEDFSLGIEFGAGFWFDVGADLYHQSIVSKTQKWIDRNDYLPKGDFQGPSSLNPLYEASYFKRVGEPVPYDKSYIDKIKGVSPVAVSLPSRVSNGKAGAKISDLLRTSSSPGGENISILKRDKREVRNTTFSYLTAKEAMNHGLEKNIVDYNPDSIPISGCNNGAIKSIIQRTGGYRKAHHISEITVTGDDGKRSVYGIPVYNTYQEEASFSVGENLSLRNKGLINYNSQDNSASNNKGRENYYSKEKTPGYATSYLLTSILSPDYIDRTGNGVSDDDAGTAVKFNYTKLNSLYHWRTPFAFGADTANYNEGFTSDALDDKANYVYGEKEIWYLHSIESKTMVAQFVTDDRDDGLGVTDNHGGVNTAVRLKRLKEIRLYSKSDLLMHGNDPSKTVPIKVVHFVYDYSICKGLPNSINNTGKLTLKRIYFTFGLNNKGILNPYDFEYDTTYNFYNYRQYDRWGNFKDAATNPNGLNNSEFPYTLQNAALTNTFSSAWQLNKIILPSGGSINVSYESDDYAYVQDKRASQMCMMNGVGNPGSPAGLIDADYIYINLPFPVSSRQEMLERYFEGVNNLYYKFLLNLDGLGHNEFVPGYAELDGQPELVSNNIAKIKLKKQNGVNPVAKAGWQFLRNNLPKYAYPGSENIEGEGSDISKAIKALVTAFGTLKELIYGFNKRAQSKGYANQVDLSKSWVRLCSPTWKKLGGGSRVKRIDISDDWANMSGTPGAQTSTYSQVYDYTTKDNKGRSVSSGVASYEPMLGNDENPFRQPVRYKQTQFLGLNNYYYIEEPFCESFFPAASVGYSKVTVKTIGTGDAETVNRTGTVVSEFFTAKDYPVKVNVLGLQTQNAETNKIFKLIGGISFEMVGLSQGYSIELNDMHGKPKSVNVFNKSGQNISSVEYFYKSVNELAEKKELSNNINVINPDGTVADGTIGMDVEMFTDMRQETTDNLGESLKISGGSGAIFIWPLPFFFPGIGVNYDRRSYRAASAIKIINRFAIQYKVKKVENGSHITSENLLWDAETGNILLTKTQNEFDDPIYSFAYPAHWKYDRMGQAFQNLGTMLTGFSTGSNGQVLNSAYNSLLVPGDELIDINSANKYWIINSAINSNYANRVINEAGAIQVLNSLDCKLIRSGRKNMANTAIATIASLSNPIVGDRLNISQLTKILDAKATVFNEAWSVPVYRCITCPAGYSASDDGQSCYKDISPATVPGCFTVCQGSHDSSYSIEGTFIYQPGYNLDGTGQYADSITNAGNSVWVGGPCPLSRGTFNNSKIQTQGSPKKTGVFDSSKIKARSKTTSTKTSLQSASASSALSSTTCNINPADPWDNTLCGPLHRTSVWACQGNSADYDRLPTNMWIGFSKCLTIDVAKTYYIGIGGDNGFSLSIDGVLKFSVLDCYDASPFRKWRIYPIYLTQGQHILEMQGYNCAGPASFGAEVYNNTVQELKNAGSLSNLHLLFSTRSMVGQNFDLGANSCPANYALNTCTSPFTCRSIVSNSGNNIFNPYYTGTLGNWRPQSQFVYQVKRENLVNDPTKFGSTDIRKSGAYSVFNPFWQYNASALAWDQNASGDVRWIAANEVTLFNNKGLEVENKDALNRYSSALFGYLESMPVAVASNAQYRETGYDGFEDYGFSLGCGIIDTCNKGHFTFKNLLNGNSVDTTSLYAHTGKYSLKLNGSLSLNKSVYTGSSGALFTFDNSGRYNLGSNESAKGFSPLPGKKYVLSFWIKDASPRDATTTFMAAVNGTNLINSALKWPLAEGWKRIETQFVLPAQASNFSLQLQSGGGTVYVDDIRIHPFDGQMKSFAYDPSSQRLMAEMDENNFATFYEYDDEGTLIRVKKETERGIMTVKETRSSYRKRQ